MTEMMPGGTGSDGIERFERTLDALTRAYGQLDALSRRQRDLIDAGDMDRLLALLSERQTLVIEIERASPGFDLGRRLWEERAESLPLARANELRRRVRAIEQMAQDIAERDKQAALELGRLRDDLSGQMAGLGRANAAVSAYRPANESAGPRFQDRKG